MIKFGIPFLLLLLVINNVSAQKNKDHKYSEFDFWIGEWNVYKHGTDTIVGKSTIEAIIDNKVIKETYHATTSKYHGTSLNKYNPRTDQWEQFWVDNSGLTLHIQGNLVDGKMILQNNITTKKGSLSNKISWQKNTDNTVRQIWSQSTDQGKTWKIVFDGDYKPITEN
ncbi:hypothetical protein [Aquimarina sp. SS2-1]|uniref:hypothetical protein n=1 Tax=Aquimarina besae TaxID=3342247 RepID=UPI0036708388